MKSKQMMPAGRPARIRGKCAAFLAALLAAMWLFSTLATALGEGGEASRPQRTVYGASEQGRELVCWRVGPEDASRAFLMVFAVHGFEDRFARDGLLLAQIARRLLDHYALYPEALGDTALYIVPCANPDGLAEGSSNTGFGRCNALGLDINRDFPEGWVRRGQSANRTGEAPLSTAEARALVGLAEEIRPDWACDVHGYVNTVKYGANKALAAAFAGKNALNTGIEKWQSGGMLSVWLDTVTAGAVLIELPTPLKNGNVNVLKDGYTEEMAERLRAGLEAFLSAQ